MRGTVDFYGLLGIFSDPLFGAPFRATLVFVYHRLGDLLRIGREAFTSRPHWFYTGILRGPKRFSSKTFRFAPNSVHSSGNSNSLCFVSKVQYFSGPASGNQVLKTWIRREFRCFRSKWPKI